MSILSDRLNKCATELGISQSEVARLIGATPPAVSMIFNGRVAKPRKWRELADVLKIDQDEMVELMHLASTEALAVARASRQEKAQKEMLSSMESALSSTPSDVRPGDVDDMKMTPVFGLAVPGGNGKYKFNRTVLDYLPCPPALKDVHGAYATYVDGMEMFPRYKPGEIVWFHPAKVVRPGDDVMIQIRPRRADWDNIGYLRRFVSWGEGEVTLGRYGPEETWTLKLSNVDSIDVIVFASKY